jgi:hypothetical protein
MNTPPKPSRLLILHALFVIAQAIIWMSYIAAGIGDRGIGGPEALIVLPLSIYILAAQYTALVRRRAKSAQRVGILLGALSLFWGYGALVVFALFPSELSFWLRLGVFAFMEVVSAQLWFAGSANRSWGGELALAEIYDSATPKHTFTLLEMFLITTITAAILGLTMAWIRAEPISLF